jgi:GNAT superfamily N-acetyltransferase
MEVRRAFANDISALYAMLREMHSNTELEVSPIDDYKLLNKINEIVHKGLVLVSYEGNEITGSIAGIRISDWWSSEPILSDIWFYVSPLHRKSRSALMLIKAFIKIAKDAKVKIRLVHIYSGDIERKDKFYEKLGLVKAGSTYVEKK